ncbi:hypothetical protein ABMX48_12905, partial [Streptomyces cavourensis]
AGADNSVVRRLESLRDSAYRIPPAKFGSEIGFADFTESSATGWALRGWRIGFDDLMVYQI